MRQQYRHLGICWALGRSWGHSRDLEEYGCTHPRELSGAIPWGALLGAGAWPSAVGYQQMLHSGDDCHPGSVG